MEQEDMKFYLEEKLYDLGKEQLSEGIDEYAKNSKYRDSVMQVVDACGIDYIELYKKLHASENLNGIMQKFVGGLCKIPETNTEYKSYIVQYALHEMIKKAYSDRDPALIFQNLLRLKPDYQGMYRLFKCRDIQPINHLYDKNNLCELFIPNNEEEYILIGRAETKKTIDYTKISLTFAYQGIVRKGSNEQQIPFQECITKNVNEEPEFVILENLESPIEFIRKIDVELEDEDYLWPKKTVFKLLNLHMEFDFMNGRYIAVNQKKDAVFIMKKWSSSYKGDIEYQGNAIPLYSGTELYVKKEYLGVLEQQFGPLMMKTCVETYTQNY